MARERYLLNAGEDTIHANEIKLVTAKDKRKNWWFYHKVHLLIAVVAVALVGSFIYSMATKVEPDYTIALITSYSMPQTGLEQLEACITPYADDRNGDGQVDVYVANYIFYEDPTADYQQQEASLVRFIADATNNQSIIFLHDETAFDMLANANNLEGFFQYNDGTPMPMEADDYENAMVPWSDLKAFANFQPQTSENDSYDPEVLTELYSRLRVSLRAEEGSSIEKSDKDMAYYQDCLALYDRLKNDQPITGDTTAEEG